MKTKSKYSPFARYYTIRDPKNNFYWEKNIPYGFNFQNQAVFETRFVDNIQDATALQWEEALEVMDRFKEPHISGGRWKADTSNLLIERRPELISKEDEKLFPEFFKDKKDEQDS